MRVYDGGYFVAILGSTGVNFDEWIPKFMLVKPKAADVNTLLGHQSRSAAELRSQVQ